MRQEARWRKRRIVYNNDGDDVIQAEGSHDKEEELLVRGEGGLIEDFLDARTGPLVGTQVDSSWYCSCMAGQTFSHHTKLGGFYGKGIPQELISKYGRDSLQIQTDYCHENGIEAFWSLRMNDAHDSHPPGTRRWTYGLARFKRDHPEFMMGEPADWERYTDGPRRAWTHLDFGFPEVREHIFSVIQEVCQGYDIDGVELDFLRSYPYFRETLDMLPVQEEHISMMTDLLRKVRRLADDVSANRGRPLLLAVRTPHTVADARFIGLDLETWLDEDLLDLFIPGGGTESVMTGSFVEAVALGHKHEIPVYPCIGWGFWNHWAYLALSAERHPTHVEWLQSLRQEKKSHAIAINGWEGTLPSWRGAAANLLNAGADGIYTFNGFFAGPQVWVEIGSMDTMAGKTKLFGIDQMGGDSALASSGDRRRKAVKPSEPLRANFQVGEAPSSSTSLLFRLHLWELTAADELRVALNGVFLKDLKSSADLGAAPCGCWLETKLDEGLVRTGKNDVELHLDRRNEKLTADLILDGVQLEMRFDQSG
jgi:hypothetical protein